MSLRKLRFNNLCKQIARNTSELRLLSANESIRKLYVYMWSSVVSQKYNKKNVQI